MSEKVNTYSTTEINTILDKANMILQTNSNNIEQCDKLVGSITDLTNIIDAEKKNLDICARAANLLSNVADEKVNSVIDKVTSVINRALKILFPTDSRTVAIEKTMYKNIHPHFVLVLKAEDGETRSFLQSGSGLAQVVSFLFTVCLIDLIGGRKILVMDELLNGLHPRAKVLVADILKAMEGEFQFVLTEYQLDVGKQYEVIKEDGTARVEEYIDGDYYFAVANERELAG